MKFLLVLVNVIGSLSKQKGHDFLSLLINNIYRYRAGSIFGISPLKISFFLSAAPSALEISPHNGFKYFLGSSI